MSYGGFSHKLSSSVFVPILQYWECCLIHSTLYIQCGVAKAPFVNFAASAKFNFVKLFVIFIYNPIANHGDKCQMWTHTHTHTYIYIYYKWKYCAKSEKMDWHVQNEKTLLKLLLPPHDPRCAAQVSLMRSPSLKPHRGVSKMLHFNAIGDDKTKSK